MRAPGDRADRAVARDGAARSGADVVAGRRRWSADALPATRRCRAATVGAQRIVDAAANSDRARRPAQRAGARRRIARRLYQICDRTKCNASDIFRGSVQRPRSDIPDLRRAPRHPADPRLPARRGAARARRAPRHPALPPAGGRQLLSALLPEAAGARRSARVRRHGLPPPRRQRRCASGWRRATRGRTSTSSTSRASGAAISAPAIAVNDQIFERVERGRRRGADRLRARGRVAGAARGAPRASAPRARRLRSVSGPGVAVRRAAIVRAVEGLDRADRDAEGERPARPRRRRLPDRHEVGAGAQPAGPREVHRLQRRRERAGHDQGPPHHDQRRRTC